MNEKGKGSDQVCIGQDRKISIVLGRGFAALRLNNWIRKARLSGGGAGNLAGAAEMPIGVESLGRRVSKSWDIFSECR